MLYSAPLLAILIPLILLQYGFALFCLVKLVFLDLPKKIFFPWNFFILLAVGVGIITFLVCYYGFRDKVFPKRPEPEVVPKPEPESDIAQDAAEPDEVSVADAETEPTAESVPETAADEENPVT